MLEQGLVTKVISLNNVDFKFKTSRCPRLRGGEEVFHGAY